MSANEPPSERYRRLAAECLDAATNVTPGEHRNALLQMGQVWQRLADQQKHSTPPFSLSTAEQPAMQQQQQVQPKDDKKE